jgi:hypothetical protein
MVAGLARVALGLSLLTLCFGQNRFVKEIPAKEAEALKQIVEDEPPPLSALRGDEDDWESPVYNEIYRNPLPIPPVKQPKK